MVELEVLLRR